MLVFLLVVGDVLRLHLQEQLLRDERLRQTRNENTLLVVISVIVVPHSVTPFRLEMVAFAIPVVLVSFVALSLVVRGALVLATWLAGLVLP